MKADQLDLFGASLPPFKITKPIRLIELFGGIGSQAKALERLGADFERWRLVEWAVPSIKAYASIHEGWRGYDGESLEDVPMERLLDITEGTSADYCSPMSREQRKRMGAKALKELASAMMATRDLCPDVSKVHPEDLAIEKEEARAHCYVMSYSFPCQDLSGAGDMKGMEKGSGTRSGLLWEVERLLLELERERETGRAPHGERAPGVREQEHEAVARLAHLA